MAETDHMNELQEMKELGIIRIASCAKAPIMCPHKPIIGVWLAEDESRLLKRRRKAPGCIEIRVSLSVSGSDCTVRLYCAKSSFFELSLAEVGWYSIG